MKKLLILLTLIVNLYSLDYKVPHDESGIWEYQDSFAPAVIVGAIGLAIYEGNTTRFGKTSVKSVDALVVSTLITSPMKYVFSRSRPNQSDRPDEWFQGSGHTSFPSGHTASVAAIVTPYILEYKDENPWVWALAAMPVYQGIGRLKGNYHWQSDVIAGGLIGAWSGWYAYTRDIPLFGYVIPDGFFVGIRTKF